MVKKHSFRKWKDTNMEAPKLEIELTLDLSIGLIDLQRKLLLISADI